MKVNNQYENINKTRKNTITQGTSKDYKFNFIDGNEDMHELLIKLINRRIEGKYEM